MDAVQTGKPPESQTHVTFETAAEHATARVPVAGPFQLVGDVREHLIGQRYESASHIVVCEADTFLGIVTIEELLLASADAKMESLMDRGAPIVAPAVDQEVAAWRAVRLALSVGVSVFAACSTATLAAMMLPWLFDAFASDPAFGSGPLATVIQDLLSIWIYLSVTTLVMS